MNYKDPEGEFEVAANEVTVILKDGERRHAGMLIPTRHVFRAPRSRQEHFFRIHHGWGICLKLARWLRTNAFTIVEIELPDGTILTSHLVQWFRRGQTEQWDRFEPQLILAEKHFHDKGYFQAQGSQKDISTFFGERNERAREE